MENLSSYSQWHLKYVKSHKTQSILSTDCPINTNISRKDGLSSSHTHGEECLASIGEETVWSQKPT